MESPQRDRHQLIESLRGGLVVSCQADPDHPLHGPATMAALSRCAERGGARAVRAEGVDDVKACVQAVTVPVIGIAKVRRGAGRPFITPTLQDCRALVAAGASMVAVEASRDYRPDPADFADVCQMAQGELGTAVMADVSTYDEGMAAWSAGADLVATTLSGYTSASPLRAQPDLDLVRELSASGVRTVLEGRVRHPDHVSEAFALGAWSVVVGTAITDPLWLTRWFADAANGEARGERAPGPLTAVEAPD